MIYFLGWGVAYFAIILGSINKRLGVFLSYGSIVVFTLIAFLRGPVGTDTANYEGWAYDARFVEVFLTGMEPGFLSLLHVIGKCIDSDVVVVRTLALLYGLALIVFFRISGRNERFILIAFILPSFFYPYAMNGLRIGLASAVLLFAARSLSKHNYLQFALLGLMAISFHYSTAFSLVFLITFGVRFVGWKRYVHFLFIAFLLLSFFYSGGELMQEKSQTYSDYQPPDALSGLSQVLVLLMLFASVYFSRLVVSEKLRLLIVGAFFAAAFWVLAKQTYAGLRFLDLLVFVFPLSFLIALSKSGLGFSLASRSCIAVAGILAAAAQYRGFLAFEGVGASPFLPYSTFFN